MNLFDYLHDKILAVLLSVSGLLLLSFYLVLLGNTLFTVFLIGLVWIGVLLLYFGLDYYKRKQYFSRLTRQVKGLEKPYLIHELMEKTWYYEDELYKEILRLSNTSAMDAIMQLEEEQKEYKEFIEAWIHEVKLPITSLHLSTAALEKESAGKLQTYLIDLENQVDQALFYARSDYVHQDFFIREVALEQVIHTLLKKNKYLLIHNHMQVSVACEETVYTDEKWLAFIVNQLVVNSVKYKKEAHGQLFFTAASSKNQTILTIKDMGIGIAAHELPRVFDKGFTGTNGRNREKATGFGLYLCKKLCGKLGLTISCDSVENKYTELRITFPKNSYLSEL